MDEIVNSNVVNNAGLVSEDAKWYGDSFNGAPRVIPSANQEVANEYSNIVNILAGNRDYNNAWSAKQAAISRDWSAQEAEKTRLFNMIEAGKNRDFQAYLSNTAHQREIADLKAAGLNPVLSALGGNGAAVTSGSAASSTNPPGATANTDESANAAIATILATVLNNEERMNETLLNAKLTEEQNELARSLSLYLGELSAMTSQYGADRSAGAVAYSAMQSAMASMYGTDWNYQLGLKSLENQADIAMMNRSNSLDIAEKELEASWKRLQDAQKHEKELKEMELGWKEDNPQNIFAAGKYVGKGIGTLLADLFTSGSGSKKSNRNSSGTGITMGIHG